MASIVVGLATTAAAEGRIERKAYGSRLRVKA